MSLRRALPDDVILREMTDTDVASIRSFHCANPDERWTQAAEVVVQVEVVPLWRRGGIVLVAERAGAVVGVIAISGDEHDPAIATSQVLAVAPEHRRVYIGYNLKLEALRVTAALGMRLMTSEVEQRNIAMRACNRCFGAVEEAEPQEPELLYTVIVSRR